MMNQEKRRISFLKAGLKNNLVPPLIIIIDTYNLTAKINEDN